MRYLTAGESHGQMLVGILEGFPAGFCIDDKAINADLCRRQHGYGRGERMHIEQDAVRIVAGVRNKTSLGSPIALLIENKDYANWADVMSPQECDVASRKLSAVRPGHADLVGCKKFNTLDARNVLESSSARSTAMTVALGGVCRQFLRTLGVEVGSYVTQIGGAKLQATHRDMAQIHAADASPVRTLDKTAEQAMMNEIDCAKAQGDTVGGAFTVVVKGLVAGLGTCMEQGGRLNGILMGAVAGIHGIKAVSLGAGEDYASALGSHIHDAIYPDGKGGYYRSTNNAGGIEGGMTNGEDIVLRAVMKPIPTTAKGIASIDVRTMTATTSAKERADVCAVPAAGVVAEAVVMLELTKAILAYTGGCEKQEILSRWK